MLIYKTFTIFINGVFIDSPESITMLCSCLGCGMKSIMIQKWLIAHKGYNHQWKNPLNTCTPFPTMPVELKHFSHEPCQNPTATQTYRPHSEQLYLIFLFSGVTALPTPLATPPFNSSFTNSLPKAQLILLILDFAFL